TRLPPRETELDADKLIAALERFFLDIIGLLIPGGLLLVGIWTVLGDVKIGNTTLKPPGDALVWWFWAAVAYILGQAITTVGQIFFVRPAACVVRQSDEWLLKQR